MEGTRREFWAVGLAGVLGMVAAGVAEGQEMKWQEAVGTPGQPLPSFAENFGDMKVAGSGANQGGTSTFRPICDGITAVGARIEVHETTLNPGAEPHPPHTHKHEEFLIMVKGRVEVTIEGVAKVVTPGSVSFWKSMALHHAKNVGSEVAQYVVVSVGTDS